MPCGLARAYGHSYRLYHTDNACISLRIATTSEQDKLGTVDLIKLSTLLKPFSVVDEPSSRQTDHV
eukprot:5547875-Lingulodinium_polyedra.AAC.1